VASLSLIQVVVLDECDKMLSLGFAKELSRLRELLLEPPSQSFGGAAEGCVATGGANPQAAKKQEEEEQSGGGDAQLRAGGSAKMKKLRRRQEGVFCNACHG
jgi:hypothetical protein